jgi:hypothetical protein
MDYFFGKKTTAKPVKSPKVAFLSIEERLDKLMQPNEKIHLYKDDDLVGYLNRCFDLMSEIEKEMAVLVKLSDYPNFKEKCTEFGNLCDGIREFVNIAIDNLQHFSSFKRIKDLIEERDRGTLILRSLSIADDIDNYFDVDEQRDPLATVYDDYGMMENDFEVDVKELEEAKLKGMFQNLSIPEENDESEVPLQDDFSDEEESKDMPIGISDEGKQNLNNLVLKRMENMMNQARDRRPLTGRKHEKRVKDIREGKFKI